MLCFTAHCFRAAPAKSVVAQSSAHQCDKRQSHISSSAFSSLLLVLPGLGGAGRGGVRGGYHALCFMTSGQAGHRPAPPSHFISIPRVIIYTTESLSILSTLYLQSYYLHYLFADFQSRMTRWWWPRHSSAVCTNEIAIFLITVQLRCKHRVQDSRNNTRYPEISIIHSQ